jgi:hypothetical protein
LRSFPNRTAFLGDREGRRSSEDKQGSIAKGPALLTLMCIQAGLSYHLTCEILWAVEGSFVSYKGIEGGFELLCISGVGSAEELGILACPCQRPVERAARGGHQKAITPSSLLGVSLGTQRKSYDFGRC